MQKIRFLIFIGLLTLTSCKQQQESEKLNIAIAANMQFASEELLKKFTDQTNIACDLIISSSGKLTAQIKEGAPFDIFVSADMKYPNKLYTSGYTCKAPKIYAYGKLVLWSMIDSIHPSIDILKSLKIDHIAIANPKTAPYGTAAIEVLKQHGVYKDVKDKLVYGESISQTNQFIISKSAQIGFTSKSVVVSPKIKGKGNWVTIDESDHSSIAQGVVILKNNAENHHKAKAFYDFLCSQEAKIILENYGYSVNDL